MYHVETLGDLSRFGIFALTGEADALSFRVLCDLTANGRRVVAQCLGIAEQGFRENWNYGHNSDPHVACAMITPDLVPALAIIAISLQGLPAILAVKEGTHRPTVYCIEAKDDYRRELVDTTEKYGWEYELKYSGNNDWIKWPPCLGEPQRVFDTKGKTRNTHAMSGRVE